MRYQLLSETRGILKDINAIDFAFVNINCYFGVRYDNDSFIVVRNGKIVWKHGANWPFFSL